MVSPSEKILQVLAKDIPIKDGRRARSQASRAKIIEAMVTLIVSGNMNPSTADIAKQAGVGLRSVFRHFDDKDEIYHAVDSLLVKTYRPVIEASYTADNWRLQLEELIERRCEVSEEIAPYRLYTLAARRYSEVIDQKYRRLHNNEKATLDAVLPNRINTSTSLGRALMIAMSFDTWRLLRMDEKLSAEATVEAVKELVNDILSRSGH